MAAPPPRFTLGFVAFTLGFAVFTPGIVAPGRRPNRCRCGIAVFTPGIVAFTLGFAGMARKPEGEGVHPRGEDED